MLVLLVLLALACCSAAQHLSRLIPAPTFEEPYAPLSGGAFSGPPIPFHPDPLATYQWDSSVNASALQIFALLPERATLTPGTGPASFLGLASLLTPSPAVTVQGAGGIQMDFGLNNAAWLEFESPDLTPSDAAQVQLSISEYNEYEITNLGPKVGPPTPHPRGDGVTMYRLEIPHSDGSGLFEGVHFAWLRVNATPATPWTISALRLVCQVKPTNWGGAFAAAGDEELSRIWYLGAYTVKVNLLADQFGSILIYRGDRFSWAGDAHIAQSTAMAALGNFPFVAQNLRFTQNRCNGIESYCLYVVQSLCDYFWATNDTALVLELTPSMTPKLEHAKAIWGKGPVGFYGWDDRLGLGLWPGNAEAISAYGFLAIRTWRAWATVLTALGDVAGAAHWLGYVNASVATILAPGAGWFRPLGLFASADALTAGFVPPSDAAAMVAAQFNDSITICGLSPFNTYFVLQALAAAGELDRGLAAVHQCWGVYVRLGASTTWEIAVPGWQQLLQPGDTLPGFTGYTSQAHPWSSGATAWASAHLAGVQARLPGYASFVVAPHIAGAMQGVSARVPVGPGGAIRVHVAKAAAAQGALLSVGVPASLAASSGALHVSQVLAQRLTGVAEGQGLRVSVAFAPGLGEECSCSSSSSSGSSGGAEVSELVFEGGEVGPVVAASGRRSRVAVLPLRAGAGCHCVSLLAPASPSSLSAAAATATATATAAVAAAPPNPFPTPVYPANFVGRDEVTSGSWIGTYGAAGYFLMEFDGAQHPVQALPPWVHSVQLNDDNRPGSGPWVLPPPDSDPRALQDPRNATAPRRIGQFCSNQGNPTFALNVQVAPLPPNATYQFSFYFADYDARGRRQTVQLMDLVTLNVISEPVLVGPDFTGGVWLVWQYSRSIRIRMNGIRGDNAVLSAVLFDSVPTAGTAGRSRDQGKGTL